MVHFYAFNYSINLIYCGILLYDSKLCICVVLVNIYYFADINMHIYKYKEGSLVFTKVNWH